MANKYKYVGEGQGIPGLPHEISDEEARRLGVLDVLMEAVKNGSYIEAKENLAGARKTRSAQANESEVNDG